jgi:hypothetical protein
MFSNIVLEYQVQQKLNYFSKHAKLFTQKKFILRKKKKHFLKNSGIFYLSKSSKLNNYLKETW